MSEQNGLPVSASTELSLDENLFPDTPKNEIANESDGSIGSHLLFGLGTLLFVSPMLIPGIPLSWLTVTYVGLMGVAIISTVLWGGFSALKARRLRRRR